MYGRELLSLPVGGAGEDRSVLVPNVVPGMIMALRKYTSRDTAYMAYVNLHYDARLGE